MLVRYIKGNLPSITYLLTFDHQMYAGFDCCKFVIGFYISVMNVWKYAFYSVLNIDSLYKTACLSLIHLFIWYKTSYSWNLGITEMKQIVRNNVWDLFETMQCQHDVVTYVYDNSVQFSLVMVHIMSGVEVYLSWNKLKQLASSFLYL